MVWWALLALLPAATARSILSLRGGSLTREDVIDKLNKVPTFAIVDENDHVVPIRTETGADICWFTDAAEVQKLLELTRAASPDRTFHIAVTPLGAAFAQCQGFASIGDDGDSEAPHDGYLKGTLKLRGPRAVVDAAQEELRAQQAAQGVEPGDWVLPVYCHDDFQTPQMMPMFFSAEDFSAGWTRSGRSADNMPGQLAMMDLRVLVKQMSETDAFDWSIFAFVSSEAAYTLAQEVMAQGTSGEGDHREEEA